MDEASPELFETLWRMEEAVRREAFVDRLRDEQVLGGASTV
jgi:hypothetical protein